MSRILDCAGRSLDLQSPCVMGILNVTPDSFSDGGDFFCFESALQHARQMIADGVDVIDVGGESTRPGASVVSIQEELDRVIPLVEALVAEVSVPISIDTSKAVVMKEAVSVGAGLINDINALRSKGALNMAANLDVPICLMHMLDSPSVMQKSPSYDDVLANVKDFLLERVEACKSVGISQEQLILDPGFGFGKTLEHNVSLFNGLSQFVDLGLPILVGVSRKTMIGDMTGAAVKSRLSGGIALAALALWQGVAIIRTHDVKATSDAIKVCRALKQS